jgi:hypothetical protein
MKRGFLFPGLLADWSRLVQTILGGTAFVRRRGALGVLACLSACASAPPWSDLMPTEPVTRPGIELVRKRADERLQAALRECYQHFVVNDCRREALERHREVLHRLRAQELNLNAQDRETRQRRLQSGSENAAPVPWPAPPQGPDTRP